VSGTRIQSFFRASEVQLDGHDRQPYVWHISFLCNGNTTSGELPICFDAMSWVRNDDFRRRAKRMVNASPIRSAEFFGTSKLSFAKSY
jgi:hypothetical protein